jgi:hypothetical protein
MHKNLLKKAYLVPKKICEEGDTYVKKWILRCVFLQIELLVLFTFQTFADDHNKQFQDLWDCSSSLKELLGKTRCDESPQFRKVRIVDHSTKVIGSYANVKGLYVFDPQSNACLFVQDIDGLKIPMNKKKCLGPVEDGIKAELKSVRFCYDEMLYKRILEEGPRPITSFFFPLRKKVITSCLEVSDEKIHSLVLERQADYPAVDDEGYPIEKQGSKARTGQNR